jgi:MoaA/NifB/PqqE/SkfB family radical SAM enzyme
MSKNTSSNLIAQIKSLGIRRARVVGNGEATLHPDCPELIKELSASVKFLSMLTNGQHLNQSIMDSLATAPVNLIEISVDSCDKHGYEKSRVGGDFERLLENLVQLKKTVHKEKRRALINIRVMIRPSQKNDELDMIDFWRQFGDTVMKQYVVDVTSRDDDAFKLHREAGRYPRCSLPFKIMNVHWNGEVPLCSYSHNQTEDKKQLILGNINDNSLLEIWNSPSMRQYRAGQRSRNESMMPLCNGCMGI